ncbi:hypothetical protein BH09SUM1_BH09SUM1_19750 [soil metagenome]
MKCRLWILMTVLLLTLAGAATAQISPDSVRHKRTSHTDAPPSSPDAPPPSPAPTPARTETHYNAPRTKTPMATPAGTDAAPTRALSAETGYNALGTDSKSTIGLISTRRDDAEFTGFLEGMQWASIKMMKAPLNVAPTAAKSLEEQVVELKARGVTTFIVDSPKPDDAKQFLTNAKIVGLNVVLISETHPEGMVIPYVMVPVYYGERAAEEAIRKVGDVDVAVGYVLDPKMDKKTRDQVLEAFNRPFSLVAKKIRVIEYDPRNPRATELPAVICLLSKEDTIKHLEAVRQGARTKIIIGIGESPMIRRALSIRQLDIRLRPDYVSILSAAIAESKAKSQMPPMFPPTADYAPGTTPMTKPARTPLLIQAPAMKATNSN